MEDMEDIVRIYAKEGYNQNTVNSLLEQWNAGLYQTLQIRCQDREVQLNPLLLELVFPWLRGTSLHLADLPATAISLPDYSADAVLSLVEELLRSLGERLSGRLKAEPVKLELDSVECVGGGDPLNDDPDVEGSDHSEKEGSESTGPRPRASFGKYWRILNRKNPQVKRKPQGVWSCFTAADDDSTVTCKTCGERLPVRNGSAKALSAHLRRQHPDLEAGRPSNNYSNPRLADMLPLPLQPSTSVVVVATGGDRKDGDKRPKKMEKRSAAWQFFTELNAELASCLECSAHLSTKHGSTKGLISHLRAYHPAYHQQFINSKVSGVAGGGTSSVPQPVSAKAILKQLHVADIGGNGEMNSQHCSKCHKGLSNDDEQGSHRQPLCQACSAGLEGVAATTAASAPSHVGGKKYRLCTECGKSVQNLAKHLKMHRGVKPDRLQCHVCEKTLCSANALKVHVESVHEGIRRFACKFCSGASFIYASHLKQHILVVHRDYRNPKAACPECGKQFKFISAMRRHRRIVHLGQLVPKKHFCPHCRVMFYKESLLNAHLRDVHGLNPPRRKPPRSRDSLVEKSSILEEYPELLKPEDLEFGTQPQPPPPPPPPPYEERLQ